MTLGDIDRLVLVVMAGMPGAGKSTVANGIGRAFGWAIVDKDVVASALLDAGIPEDAMQPAAYEACFALVRDLLVRQRLPVIFDSPCGLPMTIERAAAIGQEAEAMTIPVLCSTARDRRNGRVRTRVAMRSQPVGESRTPGYAWERFAHVPADRIEIVTDGPVEEAVAEAVEAISERMVER